MSRTIQTPAAFTLSVDGMSCGHCVREVTSALAAVPGIAVRSAAVGSAQITALDELTVARAIAALEEAGYPAGVDTTPEENSARGATGASCCSGANKNAARGGCCG